MFFKQFVHEDLGCASYMVCSTQTGECAVVDPRWEIEPYLEIAEQQGFRITHVVETHNHAVCRSGIRSAAATSALIKAGHPNVYNLAGGILAWEHKGLPVKR
jgi:hydroxyacylglutathione hydrolase